MKEETELKYTKYKDLKNKTLNETFLDWDEIVGDEKEQLISIKEDVNNLQIKPFKNKIDLYELLETYQATVNDFEFTTTTKSNAQLKIIEEIRKDIATLINDLNIVKLIDNTNETLNLTKSDLRDYSSKSHFIKTKKTYENRIKIIHDIFLEVMEANNFNYDVDFSDVESEIRELYYSISKPGRSKIINTLLNAINSLDPTIVTVTIELPKGQLESFEKTLKSTKKKIDLKYNVLEEKETQVEKTESKTTKNEIKSAPNDNIKIDKDTDAELKKRLLSDKKIIVFDLETTGFSSVDNKIIEIGATSINAGKISSFQTFVNPEISIPRKITELTGITNSDVSDAPTINKALFEFLKFCDFKNNDVILVAHNANFDIPFINQNLYNCFDVMINSDVICTLEMARNIYDFKSNKLIDVAKNLKIKFDTTEAHRADHDSNITAKVFMTMINDISYKKLNDIVTPKLSLEAYELLKDTNYKNIKFVYSKSEYIPNNTALKLLEKIKK